MRPASQTTILNLNLNLESQYGAISVDETDKFGAQREGPELRPPPEPAMSKTPCVKEDMCKRDDETTFWR